MKRFILPILIILIANFSNAQSVSFLEGNPIYGDRYRCSSLIDVNGDSFPDVVAGNYEGVVVRLNESGSQEMVAVQTFLFDEAFHEILGGDVDMDGDTDLICKTQDNLFWLENTDGLGDFSVLHDISSDDIDEFVVSDLDSDGDPDVLCRDEIGDLIFWYKNNNAEFSSSIVISLNVEYPSKITVGNFDEDDEYPDIIVSNYLGLFRLENTDGNANFSDTIRIPYIGSTVSNIDVADIDGDEANDLLAEAGEEVFWLQNLGDAYSWNQTSIGSHPDLKKLKAIDLDADGDLDVLFDYSDDFDGGIKYFRHEQRKSMSFTPAFQLIEFEIESYSYDNDFEIGDWNHDGYPDFIFDLGWRVYLTIQNETIGNYEDFNLALPYLFSDDLAYEDINSDGYKDIVFNDSRLCYLPGTAQPTEFSPLRVIKDFSLDPLSTYYDFQYEVADLDGEGDLDFIVMLEDSLLTVSNTDGMGNYQTSLVYDEFDVRKGLLVEDIDSDEFTDVLFCVYNTDISKYEMIWAEDNSGNGTSWTSNTFLELSTQVPDYDNIRLVDIDSDGDLDILYALEYFGGLYWRENTDGNYTFSDANTILNTQINSFDIYDEGDDFNGEIYVQLEGSTMLLVFKYNGTEFYHATGDNAEMDLGNSSTYFQIHNFANPTTGLPGAEFDAVYRASASYIAFIENFNDSYDTQIQEIPGYYNGLKNLIFVDMDNDGDDDLLFNDTKQIIWIENLSLYATQNPQNNIVCPAAALSFTVDAIGAGINPYQWQVDDGSGFVNISDGEIYSGCTTNELQIDSARLDMTMFAFRCRITNVNDTIYSEEGTLIVQDAENPEITCPPDLTIDLESGESSFMVGTELEPLSSSDNCSIFALENDMNFTETLTGESIDPGDYTITWTVTDLASNTNTCTLNLTVNQYVGVGEESLNFSLYPNPVEHTLHLDLNQGQHQNYEVKIINAFGQTVASQSLNGDKAVVDVSEFPAGLYLVEIHTKDSVSIKRIQKL
jgi:hypothetical protein